MIPNIEQLLLVCGIVSVVVFGIVYVLVNILGNTQQSELDED
ncbi:hypothetical protein [Alteromonas facilis]|nr:hypothetical protein [Alteromonas facilis]